MIISLVVGVWNLAKLHRPIQAGRLCTREGILRMVTSQGLLVENCPIPTEEAPSLVLGDSACVISYGVANVEHLGK